MILLLSVILVFGYIAKSVCQALLQRYQSRQLAAFTARLTNETVHHILYARYSTFLEIPGSEIGGAAYANPVHVTLVYRALIQILSEILFISTLCLALLILSPMPTLIALCMLLLIGLLIFLTVIRNTAALGVQQSQVENSRYRLIFAIVNAIRDIKLMGLAPLFEQKNREVSAEYESVAWRYNFNNSLPLIFIEVAVFVGLVSMVVVVISAGAAMAQLLPTIGVVAVAAIRAVPAVAKLIMALNAFRFYSNLTLRFKTLSHRLQESIDQRTLDDLHFQERLVMQDVSFSHGVKRILDGISLEIQPGRSYGVVGPSGAGKSTLLDVFTGLQPATSGRFFCDGREFSPSTSRSMEGLIGYVPQNITLLDETIGFNIGFGRQFDPSRIERAVRVANLREFIDSQSDGLATYVGENGAKLSGGQRQRIGIARAVYRQPKILVFDEATSALDAQTEREFLREIAALRGEVATVIVSHKISVVEDCDVIFVMSRGRIVDSGSHNELLQRCELYRELYQLQAALD